MRKHKVDKYVFLGDAVGYMPYGIEVINLLKSINAICLMGNHEAMLCGMLGFTDDQDEVYQIRRVLSEHPSLIDEVKYWLPFGINTIDGLKLLFVHGSPWDPIRGYVYPDSLWQNYNNPRYDFIFLGHSHRPFIVKNDPTTIVNVGSCGLPRDIGNFPSFVIFNTMTGEIKEFRFELDIQELLADLKNKNVHNSVIDCLNRKKLDGVISD
jgi:predicted phosphodiesterase